MTHNGKQGENTEKIALQLNIFRIRHKKGRKKLPYVPVSLFPISFYTQKDFGLAKVRRAHSYVITGLARPG